MTVRLRDGIIIETETLGKVKCDGRTPDAALNLVSHAHTDHLPSRIGEHPIICSPLTADLAGVRRDLQPFDPAVSDLVDLLPSGHVDGGRAFLIEDADRRVLFTGDVATRSRFGLDGFEPVSADVLIVEATYGAPEYTFPGTEELAADVETWLRENDDRPVILFAYAFGKAQRVLALLDRIGVGPVHTTDRIRELNQVIGVSTPETVAISDEHTPAPGEIFLLSGRDENLESSGGPATAAFSGWAIDSGYRYRRGVDRGFALSDHCDFGELLALVDAVDPELTYTHHGHAEELARALTRRGHEARALKRNQPSLDAFG